MQPIAISKSARALASMRPSDILRARKGEGDPGLVKAVRAAQDTSAALKDCFLQLEIEAVRCLSFNFDGLIPEATNEVYLAAWVVDGKGNKSVGATTPVPGYRKGDLITFSTNGRGVPVVTLKNPQDYVHWGFMVCESDAQARTTAQSIKQALDDNDVERAIGKVVAAAGAGELANIVTDAAIAINRAVLDLVRRNADDHMYGVSGGGVELAGFNAHDPDESETHESRFARVRYAVHLYK